ncbi:hypothetical protein QQ045_004911 [Rhodiola kirilowii]
MADNLNAGDDNQQTRGLEDESFLFVSVNGRNCWIPKCPDDFKPYVGMTFPNLEKVVLFYKEYARIAGFVVRLATSNSSAGIITIKYLVCQREGFKPKSKAMDSINIADHNSRLRRDTRCGCQARIQLNICEGGRYRVYFFEESHNHSLESDIGKQFLTSHREMSLIDKQLVMECGKVRIGATKAHHIRKELCGGFMNIGATVTDYKNFKRDLKLYIGLNDAQMVVDNLSDKIKTCPGFSFEYFLDEEGILTRLFWADVISMRDNIIFGDVISFDATYRMNKYNLVFVPFTGVDNQLRSVTLAAGLISKEDVESYTWLLTCFKKLSERGPSVIVTDQDASMKAAIATIFPSSRHRFCMWHITEKLQAKVGISKYRESGFLTSIKAVIWGEYKDSKEFETSWQNLICKYDLHANSWLATMYDLRLLWIPIYFRDVHMGALLRTTSRSESENSFFGRYIHRSLTLVEFFFGFNSAMDLQRQNRVQIYPESRRFVPTLNSTQKLEKDASETFSYPVFKIIQSEMSESAYGCAIQSINEDEFGRMYIINDASRDSRLFQVTFPGIEGRLKCSCMKFESCGYICRHIFKVMFFLRYEKIPDYLVMGRWHIDASRKHNPSMFLVDHENPNQTREQITLASEIWFHVNAALCIFKTDVGSIRKFHDHIYEYVKVHAPSAGAHCSVNNDDYFRAVLQMPQPTVLQVNNPGLSRNKGCGKRIRGPREIAIEKYKKLLDHVVIAMS